MKLTEEQAKDLGLKITELLEGSHWLLAFMDEDGGVNVIGHSSNTSALILAKDIAESVIGLP